MNFFQILKGMIILPFAWVSVILNEKKPIEVKYAKLQYWANILIRGIGYRLTCEGYENIDENETYFFVSNHQGTLDPALLVATFPKPMTFISKQKNERMPIFGRCARSIDVIHFDHETRVGNVYMLREAARYLKKGRSVLVFPEGTRSKKDQMNPFKEGALQPAYLAKATIIPVTLNNAYCIDNKKDKRRDLKITYGKPIPYSEYQGYSYTEFADILFNEIESKIIYSKS